MISEKAKDLTKCLVTGVLILVAIFAAIIYSGDREVPSSNETPKRGKVSPEFDHSKPYFIDGMYEVGKDIEPGTYRTRKGQSGCYYERLSGFSRTVNDIISNDNTDSIAIITISPTDAGFKSNRCGIWIKQ